MKKIDILMKNFINPSRIMKKEDDSFKVIIKKNLEYDCGDELTFFYQSDKEYIRNIYFKEDGCSLAVSFANIICSLFSNEKKDVIKNNIRILDNMVNGREFSFEKKFSELEVFSNIYNFKKKKLYFANDLFFKRYSEFSYLTSKVNTTKHYSV